MSFLLAGGMRALVFVVYALFWVYALLSCRYPDLRPLPVIMGIALHITVVIVARLDPFRVNFGFFVQNEDLIAGIILVGVLASIFLAILSMNPFLLLAGLAASAGFGIGLTFER